MTGRRRRVIGFVFPAMVGGRVLGAALMPFLFAHLPVALIALSPFLVHLVLVAPVLEPGVYFSVALCVTTVQCIIGFEFGTAFGPRAIAWLVERTPVSEGKAERLLAIVRKASALAVFAVPGPILGTVAGAAQLRKKTFYAVVAPAQTIWVTAAYFVGEALLTYIEIVRSFVTGHALELTALTVTVVGGRWAYSRWSSRRQDVHQDAS